jgi:uncharacterized RDD family membrane protein YckC
MYDCITATAGPTAMVTSTVSSGAADREEFAVQGMTGVDLSLLIAGPGSRAYAFIIDWHIRLVVAIAWVVVSMISITGSLRFNMGRGQWTPLLIFGPAAAIYLLYHPIVELLMRGQSPGKRMAGVRIVSRDGGPPSAGAILIRNAFRLIDTLPLLYVLGLASTLITEQRIRIGDMAAGTLLVTNDADAATAMSGLVARSSGRGLDPAALDVVEQLLERWKEMEPDRRGSIARALLQRIDAVATKVPAEMSDVELHARLLALSGSAQQ